MHRTIILAFISLTLLFVACNGNRSAEPVSPTPTVINTSDYLFINITKPIILREDMHLGSQTGTYPERTYACEKVIIDRLIDNNGNGVYDAGIDTFEDFNNNNLYDPPIDGWPSGTPRRFDDLNYNGLYDCAGVYFTGAPYFDANSNGKWDGNQPYLVDVGYWDTLPLSPSNHLPTVGFLRSTPAFRFVSDSSIAYNLDGDALSAPSLSSDSVGIRWNKSPWFIFARHGRLPLDTAYADTFHLGDSLIRLRRTVTYLPHYSTPDSTFTDVVRIRIDSIYVNDTLKNCPCPFAEACFTRHRGLLSLTSGLCEGAPSEWTWWVSDQVQSIPVPLRQ